METIEINVILERAAQEAAQIVADYQAANLAIEKDKAEKAAAFAVRWQQHVEVAFLKAGVPGWLMPYVTLTNFSPDEYDIRNNNSMRFDVDIPGLPQFRGAVYSEFEQWRVYYSTPDFQADYDSDEMLHSIVVKWQERKRVSLERVLGYVHLAAQQKVQAQQIVDDSNVTAAIRREQARLEREERDRQRQKREEERERRANEPTNYEKAKQLADDEFVESGTKALVFALLAICEAMQYR